MIELIRARSAIEFEAACGLFLEYAASLGFNLCFQGFDKELESLPFLYNPPHGELILARSDSGEYVGCIGVKRFDDLACEMKRLYLKPSARGEGIGLMLVRQSILAAEALGYRCMRLDTIRDKMQTAISIYFKQGFVEIPAYYHNPMENVLYMEKILKQ